MMLGLESVQAHGSILFKRKCGLWKRECRCSVANTGITAGFDPYGRILGSIPLGESGALDLVVPESIPPPPFARFGNAGFFVC